MSPVDLLRRGAGSRAATPSGRVLPLRRPAPPARVLVVVPAFNEQSTVAQVVTEVRTHNPGVDVLVVDDGSADATADLARDAGALVCRLPFNLGVGGAMRAGFRFALDAGYDAVVQVDADGQHDASYIPALLRGLAEADVVIGARFAGAGDYQARGARRWAMALLAFVVSRLAHAPLTDVTSGYRAANRRAMRVFAAHYPAEYLGDTVESLIIALRSTCLVTQVPVAMRIRGGGRASQSPLRAAAYLLRACAAIALALVRRWPMPARLEEV
jgi:glycosyltransferase involved in cell wall biosynthesis